MSHDNACLYCAKRFATDELLAIHMRHFCPLRNAPKP